MPNFDDPLQLDQLEIEARASESIASSVVLELIDELRKSIEYADFCYKRMQRANAAYYKIRQPTVVITPERRQELADAEHDSHPELMPYT